MSSIGVFLTTPCVVVAVTAGEPSTPAAPQLDDMGMPIVEDDMGQTPSVEQRTDTVCDIQQTNAQEIRDGGIVDVTTWRAFLPPDNLLDAGDRIELADGRAFSVEGSSWLVRDPFEGTDSHVEAHVRLVQ